MFRNIIVVAAGLVFASSAMAQTTNTICNVSGNSVYCNSYGSGDVQAYTAPVALDVQTPSEVMRQGAEARLASIRAQEAQAELNAYLQTQAQRRGELEARQSAFAAKLVRCSEANPTDAGYNACMGGETAP